MRGQSLNQAPVALPPKRPPVVRSRSKSGNMAMTEGNRAKGALARQVMAEVMRQVMTKGFYGQATVRLKAMDGTVQQVDQVVERSHR